MSTNRIIIETTQPENEIIVIREMDESGCLVTNQFPLSNPINDVLPSAKLLLDQLATNDVTEHDKAFIKNFKNDVIAYVFRVIADAHNITHSKIGDFLTANIHIENENQALLLLRAINNALQQSDWRNQELKAVYFKNININFLVMAYKNVAFAIMHNIEGTRIFTLKLRYDIVNGFVNHSYKDPRAKTICNLLQNIYFLPWVRNICRGPLFPTSYQNVPDDIMLKASTQELSYASLRPKFLASTQQTFFQQQQMQADQTSPQETDTTCFKWCALL